MIWYFKKAFIFIFFISCTGIKDIEVKEVKGFSLKKIDPKGMETTLQLSILNPNKFGFSFLPSAFDVKYSGVYLGKAELTKKVKIKGKEEHTYTFELQNDFKEVNFLELLNLLQPGKFKNEINIKGKLRAGKLLMRKSFDVNYTEKVQLN